MSGLLDPGYMGEIYACVRPDGTCRLSIAKMDGDVAKRVGVIYTAILHELTAWAAGQGAHIGLIIGDGGPEYIKLKARLYAQQDELTHLRARLAEVSP